MEYSLLYAWVCPLNRHVCGSSVKEEAGNTPLVQPFWCTSFQLGEQVMVWAWLNITHILVQLGILNGVPSSIRCAAAMTVDVKHHSGWEGSCRSAPIYSLWARGWCFLYSCWLHWSSGWWSFHCHPIRPVCVQFYISSPQDYTSHACGYWTQVLWPSIGVFSCIFCCSVFFSSGPTFEKIWKKVVTLFSYFESYLVKPFLYICDDKHFCWCVFRGKLWLVFSFTVLYLVINCYRQTPFRGQIQIWKIWKIQDL